MPVGQGFDFSLNGKPFMLYRPSGRRGTFPSRSWTRNGASDSPVSRTARDRQYGELSDELDHPEVWDDWSGGFGDFSRRLDAPNRIHWSENFDLRFPRQAVHCQQMQALPTRYASINLNVEALADVPLPGVATPPAGAGAVLALGKGFVATYVPTGLNTAGSAFDARYEASGGGSTGFRGRPAIFGSHTYIPAESGNFWQRGLDGMTFTTSPLPARGFTVAGGRMWRHHSRYMLQSVAIGADPLGTANWSATLSIGNGQMVIEDGIELGDQLFLGLPDGLYAGDLSGTFVNQLPEMRNQRHIENARDLTVYDNTVLTPHVGGLFSFYPSDFVAIAREIGPAGRNSNRSPIRGRIRCVTSYGPWAYAGLWTGSQSFILAGRNGGDGYYWQVQQRIPDTARISRLHFDGITAASGGQTEIPTRVWAATDASIATGGTSPLYFFTIPRNHDNPLASDPAFTANYVGSARMDLGQSDWGAPSTLKLFRSVEVEADNLLSGVRYADVYYRVDDGARTLIGRAQQSPRSRLFFRTDEHIAVTGLRMELSIESFTASQHISPVYRSVVLRGNARPDGVDRITAIARIADNVADRNGRQMRPAGVMAGELRTMAKSGLPQVLIDPTGAISYVAVQRNYSEQEVWQDGDEAPEIAFTVQMAELDLSTNPNQPILVGWPNTAVLPAA